MYCRCQAPQGKLVSLPTVIQSAHDFWQRYYNSMRIMNLIRCTFAQNDTFTNIHLIKYYVNQTKSDFIDENEQFDQVNLS